MIDISGTQFIRPTPIAPISSEPSRTACAVSRSLPIWAFGKIWTVILPPVFSSIDFLNCSAQRCQPCAGGAGCAKRMRFARPARGPASRAAAASEASAEAPATRSTLRRDAD